MERAAGYIRVSTIGQTGDDKVSLSDQAEQIQKYCREHDLELLPIYNEGAQSGANPERQKLKQLMEDAHEHKFQHVVVWDLSRFGRDNVDVLVNERTLRRLGIKLVSVKEQFGEGAQGDMMRSMISTFNQYEREVIKQRTFAARNKLWQQKRRWIGTIPFGYSWNEKDEKLEIIEEEAATIRYMVALYLSNVDYSFNDVALQLNQEHRFTQKGKKWTSANISATLSRTVYYGYFVTNTKTYNTKGEVTGKKPIEEHIVWDDLPIIIPYVRWKAVQDKASTGLKRAGRPIKHADEFLLHGMIKCGVCGDVVVPHITVEKGRRFRYYACHLRRVGTKVLEIKGKTKCSLPLVPAELLEDWIWDILMVKFGQEKEAHFAPLLQNESFDEQIAKEDAKVETIKKIITQKERAVRRLDEQILMGDEDDYNPTEFRFKRRQYANEANQHKAELEAIQTRIKDLQAHKEEQKKFEELLGNEALLSSIWLKMDELPLSGKRRLLQGLLKGPVTLYPASYPHPPNTKHKIPPIDAAKSKPKFHYNEAILQEVLGLNKYLDESRSEWRRTFRHSPRSRSPEQ